MNELVSIDGIWKKYKGKQVLKDLSLSIPTGHIIGLLGNNGIGKTTFLKLLAGIVHADRGTISFMGQQDRKLRSSEVAFLFEHYNFYDWMKIKDAIEYYKDFFEDFDAEKAVRLCKEFDLRQDEKLEELSKGNAERVCLLLTLCRKVKLYLLDEPYGGLDPVFKKDIKKFLLANIPEGATIIIATHLLKDMETLFDKVIIFKHDEVVFEDTEEIREKYHMSVEEYYFEVMKNA